MNGGTVFARYVVTELEGHLDMSQGGGGTVAGLSCHVLDTAYNYRLVATYRTEAYGKAAVPQWVKRMEIRRMANEHAERLNAAA